MRFIISLLSTFILSFHLLAINHLRLPDIRALGTGIKGVTQSIVHNPALVTLSINKEIQVEYFNRYGLKELSTMGFQFICPNSLLPFSISVSSFGYEEYRKSFFRLGMGKSLNERWKIGISFQCDLLQTELFKEVPKCISTDVGIVFIPVENLLIGLLVMNFPTISIQNNNTDLKDIIGYSVQLGFQWKIINSLFIIGTMESNKTNSLLGNFGVEYRPFSNFFIRTGIQTNPLLPTLGLGYRFSRFTIDTAILYHPVLGVSSGIGLSYSF